ncbi:hypothetical protein [Chloroflexus sp.]|uniref:hypothetical protein n=1 Tax=Chloroflexus sp. TaxID=1904827 RepID=UPI00298EF8F9|nr:hypothetical protein [Chloroflexus sp.]MDW8404158.1 hypothetical protein [Chloroflexus sp.]
MRSSARRLPARRREPSGCAGQLIRLSVGLLVIVALYLLLARPQLSAALGRGIADLIAPSPATAEAPLPELIAALPTGEVTVSEAEINGYLAGIEQALPVEAASVRLIANRAIITVRAYGMTSVASSGITVRDGRVVPVDPQIEGPLAALVSASDLSAALNERLNAELLRQGRQVVAARIDDGILTIVLR